jgi:hypothetical protein
LHSVGSVDEFKQLYTTPDGKFDSGFYLAKNDRILLAAEIVNYRKDPQPLYVQIDIEYVPGKPKKEAVTSLSSVTGTETQRKSWRSARADTSLDCKDPMAFSGKGRAGNYTSLGAPVNKKGTVLSLREWTCSF